MYEAFQETVEFLRKKDVENPEIGIVLGTGLHQLTDKIKVDVAIDYSEIPHFPVSTVESHKGKLLYGTLNGKRILAMQGRFHFYEGYTMQQVVYPIRIMSLLGVKTLILSNAAGSVHKGWNKGSLMLIDDHIHLQNMHPLIGKNLDNFGTRFPDMGAPYDKALIQKMQETAKDLGIELNKGVYAAVQGPMLETRAEYRYLQILGADAVGMSTVPEVITANHSGMKCVAISVLTDECDPDNLHPVSLAEIIEVASQTDATLTRLIFEFAGRL
jgi:purine-nucleoside phosphorylase